MYNTDKEIVGLIPAAGFAKRIAPLPCSKEIYPIGFHDCGPQSNSQPRVISSYLLESMQAADIGKIFMVIREGKWDIPAYFQKQIMLDVNLAYLVTGVTESTAHTVDFAFPFVKDKIIAFGFPDILIEPRDAFQQLVNKQKQTSADVVLGLFKADNPQKVDMVDIGDADKIQLIDIKPSKTDLEFTWMIAVWTPVFTKFLHTALSEDLNSTHKSRELYIGDIMQQAINAGLKIDFVKFTNGNYLDIGTPADLEKAMKLNLSGKT